MRKAIAVLAGLGSIIYCGGELTPPTVSPADLPIDQLGPIVCSLPLPDGLSKIEQVFQLNQVVLSGICGGQRSSKIFSLKEDHKKWVRLIRDCVVFDEVVLEDHGLAWQPTLTSSTSTTALPAGFRLQFALIKEGEVECLNQPPIAKLRAEFLGEEAQVIEQEILSTAPAKQIDQAFQTLNPQDPEDLFSFCVVVEAEAKNPCGRLISHARLRVKAHKR